MLNASRRTFLLLLLIANSTTACSDDIAGQDMGFADATTVHDAMGHPDTGMIEDARHDMGDFGPMTDASGHDGKPEWYEDPGLVRPRAFYECGPDSAPLDYGDTRIEYRPAPSDRFEDDLSYSELTAVQRELSPGRNLSSYVPAQDISFLSALSVVNLELDQDLVFRFGFAFGNDGDTAAQWSTTLLLDYQEVDATFRFLDDQGDTVVPTQRGTGFAVPWAMQLGIVEIEIPAEFFKERGYHELLLRSAVRQPGAYPFQTGQRITVWVESNERPPHPCFERVEAVGPIPPELIPPANLSKIGFDRHMFLVPLDLVPYDQIDQEIIVEPGQIVDFEYYVLGQTGFRSPLRWEVPEVLIPAVNGEPIDEPQYVMLDVPPEEEPEDLMYKGTFEFEVPTEPGIYDVEVIQVIEAFIPFMNWAGEFNQFPYAYPVRRGGVHQGTQIVRLRVPE